MASHELTDINQEPEDYRGGLVYTQEYGYKMVTMTVNVAPNEQSQVISHAYDIPLSEEAEHLQGVDLYSFAVTDETQIQLTIDTPAESKEAWYTVQADDIVAEQSSITMTLVRSSDSIPLGYAATQEALDDALTYYADQIPNWLNETTWSTLDYERDDFGR